MHCCEKKMDIPKNLMHRNISYNWSQELLLMQKQYKIVFIKCKYNRDDFMGKPKTCFFQVINKSILHVMKGRTK